VKILVLMFTTLLTLLIVPMSIDMESMPGIVAGVVIFTIGCVAMVFIKDD
jgi:hypothetical protein